MDTYDVVIVGARCAGSPLATMLARRGLRVCLLDRVKFPRETPSTHVIQPCGVEILDELGLLDPVLAAGAVPLDRFTLVNEDVRIEGTVALPHFAQPGLCVRRVTLDALLVEAAAEAGADVRTGCRVNGVLTDESGRITGVQTEHGPIGARVTVGADGRHSTIAAATGAAEYLATAAGRVPAWGYFAGVTDTEGRLRLARKGDLAFLASPTDGGLYMAGIGIDADKSPRVSHRPRTELRRRAGSLAGAGRSACRRPTGGPDSGDDRLARLLPPQRRPRLGTTPCQFKDFTPAQGIQRLRQARALFTSVVAVARQGRLPDVLAGKGYGHSGHLDASNHQPDARNRDQRGRHAAAPEGAQPRGAAFEPVHRRRLARAAAGALRDEPRQTLGTLREIGRALKDQI